MVGLAPSPSPSLEAFPNVNDDKDDADSSNDDEMTTSQWFALCHSWKKGELVLDLRVVLYLGGELILDFLLGGVYTILRDVVRLYVFSFLPYLH